MSAKINYLRGQLTGLSAQLAAPKGEAAILAGIQSGNKLLSAREQLGEEPKRENVEALVTSIHAAVEAHNSQNTITVDSVADIMAGFDKAVDEVVEE
jgi:KaiC/GvpD/RAD55 family RecA-like ATPase